MGNYYYFAATLTTLEIGAPAPLSSAEFLAICRRHLGASDLAVVEAAVLVSPRAGAPAATESSPFLVRYYAWERTMRNELVRLRARRLERAAEPWLAEAERDDGAPRAAAAAFQGATPLEAELALERQRWEAIRSLRGLHAFDVDSIIAYRLELQVIERLALLREEQGAPRYRDTYAAILGAADTSAGVQT